MEYKFLEVSDEALLAGADLALEAGAGIALFTTGYDADEDETVSLSVVDIAGNEVFSQITKPHNRDDWQASDASGGIGPDDVADAQPLYEFEDILMEQLEKTQFIVGMHFDFIKEMLDHSWIALPKCEQIDLGQLFCASHCDAGYPGEPANVASLESICGYYGIAADYSTTIGQAQAVVACYRVIVEEFRAQRDAKGQQYWDAREQRLAAEAEAQGSANTAERIRNRRYQQMNALLWVAAGIIFLALVIQLFQRGGDIGFMIVAGAAAVFAFVRAVINWNKKL